MEVRLSQREILDDYMEQARQILTVAMPALAEALKHNKGRGFDFVCHVQSNPRFGEFEHVRRVKYQIPD